MIASARRTAAAALFCEHASLRMPIHGRSMAPSIVEPMVLQLGPAADVPIGDVIVFRRDGTHVAHRVVARTADGYVTAGDAQPQVVEHVRRDAVVGRVIALWSDGSTNAVRVDGVAHRARSWYFARFHRARSATVRGTARWAGLVTRANPRRRVRTTALLVDALRAAGNDDAPALIAALGACGETALANEQRYRCSAVLGEAVRRLGVVEALSPAIAVALRRARLDAVLGTSRMQRSVERTIAVLESEGIDFTLLKGAARIVSAVPGAAYHPSDDVDVLVREADVDRAVLAFRERGWQHRETDAEVRRFRSEHHHAASLFPPDGSFPVEIHHALATPGTVSIETTWDALAPHMRPIAGRSRGRELDAVGTALHLALHAIGLQRMRDVVLLADVLRTLSPVQRAAVQALVATERHEAVRFAASFALAAYVADIPWPADHRAARYVRWALRREDLPRALRTRCAALESVLAHPSRPWPALAELIPSWSRGVQYLALPGRTIGRVVSNAAALAYAYALHPDGPQAF